MEETITPIQQAGPALLEELTAICGHAAVTMEPEALERLSKDYYWYSPVLRRQLDDKRGDVAVTVADREQLRRVVAACCRAGVSIVMRGAGTGNYGQCVPLYGGVVIDLSQLDTIYSLEGGIVRAEPGARLGTIENEARQHGYELRCMPSTWVKSSLGGFLGGGSGGIGSITWGGIIHGDNMVSVTLMTVEEEPRLIRLEGHDTHTALHTYGTNGILVEIEWRLAPKRAYDSLALVGDDWDALLDFTDEIARDDSVPKRLVTQFQDPIPQYFLPIKKHLPEGHHATFLMVDVSTTDAVVKRAQDRGIQHTLTIPFKEPVRPPLLIDYTWNHTTLWALKGDPQMTYLQSGFGENFREQFKQLWAKFPGEILFHLEWTRGSSSKLRSSETVNVGGIPLVRFTSEERLQAIIDYCTEIGVFTANPHTYAIEEGGRHNDIEQKRNLKAEADPKGILNPGKMKTYPHNPFASRPSCG